MPRLTKPLAVVLMVVVAALLCYARIAIRSYSIDDERSRTEGAEVKGPDDGGAYPSAGANALGVRVSQSEAATALSVRSAPVQPRPNLLLIIIDTARADRLGCYGNSMIRTPNVDRLARQGSCALPPSVNPR